MGSLPSKITFDLDEYARRVTDGPCFVCAFIEGRPDHLHHLIYEDDNTVAFLNRYPTLLGYCLVAPRRHVESWVQDMEPPEFLRFQSIVHAVARAIAATLPTERMYSMSLGSQQGNAHLQAPRAPASRRALPPAAVSRPDGRERHPGRQRRQSSSAGPRDPQPHPILIVTPTLGADILRGQATDPVVVEVHR